MEEPVIVAAAGYAGTSTATGIGAFQSEALESRMDHDWIRPEGFTWQECRRCGLMKGTPAENERHPCDPAKRPRVFATLQPVLAEQPPKGGKP